MCPNRLLFLSIKLKFILARIVGGAVARPYSHPWQVRVRACSGHACTRMCGGTLVSNVSFLTFLEQLKSLSVIIWPLFLLGEFFQT